MFTASPLPPRQPKFPDLLLLAVTYFIAASATIVSTRFGGGVACLWIASPILVAYLTQTEPKNWWPPLIACAIASWLATALFGFGVAAAPAFSVINMAESALAAWLMNRSRLRAGLDSLPQVAALILFAGLIAPAVTGIAGAEASMVASGTSYWTNWLNWLTGHGLGAITILPIAILVMRGETSQWYRRSGGWMRFEALALMIFVAVTTTFVFAQDDLPLLFLPILPVIVATFRFGRFGAAMSLLLVTLLGGLFTLTGSGPATLIVGSALFHAQFYQFYTAVLVLITLPIAADLKHRKQLFEELQTSEARYRLVTDNATDIVVNLDVDGRVLYVSPSIQALAGYDEDDLTGTYASGLVHPEDVDAVRKCHFLSLAEPDRAHSVEYRGRTASGEYQWFETNTRGLIDSNGKPTGVVSVIRNISRRKDVEHRLKEAALTDPLTGLANRRAFNDAVDALIDAEVAGPACLALFDIDHFKRVNDEYGHDAGDRVLQKFAQVANQVTREGDLLARLGGEEFGLLLRGASLEAAARVCERVRGEFGSAITTIENGRDICVTVSAGVASLSPESSRADLLRSADAALYDAKHAGRNRLSLAA
ncbi:sensor domain-containing diguanylate cyclase [Stakelama marina]|uniref:Diguanylate cyclase n=1 Tax=Stakelama marina TaxID=2826939 RepID=A0A8T4II23_9SPHN|nr:diguanylate cyclase [Stakelama marina]MBR0551949.1 diguanylate cyclase [Stakelama marina]